MVSGGGREKLLILGAPPRAGNHLLRGLLDGHPQLLLPPDEDYFVRHLVRSPIMQLLGSICPPRLAPRYYRWMQKSGHLERVNAGEGEQASGTENSLDLDHYYRIVSGTHRTGSVATMIRTHFSALSAALGASDDDPRCKVFFCAMQPNNRDLLHIGRHLAPLYDIRALFVFRDPRSHYSSKLGRNPRARLRAYCRRQNRYWRQVDTFRQQFGPALRVRFEDLVTRTEETMRAVCEFAEIDYLDSTMEFTQMGRPTLSNSSFKRVAGIDSTVLTRYRSLLDADVIAQIERRCIPELLWKP